MGMSKELRQYGVRGAVCVENTPDSIVNSVKELYEKLISENNISSDDIISIIFTVTPDITALNPAAALRKAGFGGDVPLFCCAEPVFEGSLPLVIRVLIHLYSEKKPVPAYLNGAERLRPDLAKNAESGGRS
jgi:chorismate mutase